MAGIIVRRQDTGAVILRLTDRITRTTGAVISISGSGSFTLPDTEGTPWIFVRYPQGYPTNQSSSVKLTGRVLTWSFVQAGTQVVYGVY